MIICWGVRNASQGFIGGSHVFVLHAGEVLEFVPSVMYTDFEYVVGLLLDFLFPLVSTGR
jgi:hypothetical protein